MDMHRIANPRSLIVDCWCKRKKASTEVLAFDLERQKSLELSTYTLARYRSTN
jgi:hypothetical protein